MYTISKLFIACIFPLALFGQTPKTEISVQTVVPERTVYLNGGARASMGGKSRTLIKVDLPANTKSWYYSFTTLSETSGTEVLNLAVQLAALAKGGKLLGSAASGIRIPPGSESIDVYLLQPENADPFVNKVDNSGGSFYYIEEGTTFNTRQGTVAVDDVIGGTVYLGLKNPSTLNGINIQIEVVAITETYVEDELSVQATNLGNMGWKCFERGEYDRCLQLSQSALDLDNSLGFVHFNVALCYLIKGMNMDAMTAYSRALAINRKLVTAGYNLEGAINDLYMYMDKFPSRIDALDILEILEQEREARK